MHVVTHGKFTQVSGSDLQSPFAYVHMHTHTQSTHAQPTTIPTPVAATACQSPAGRCGENCPGTRCPRSGPHCAQSESGVGAVFVRRILTGGRGGVGTKANNRCECVLYQSFVDSVKYAVTNRPLVHPLSTPVSSVGSTHCKRCAACV